MAHVMAVFMLFSIVLIGELQVVLSDPPITGYATCDDEMWLYADGNQVVHNNQWNIASPVNIPGDTRVVGIACRNPAGHGAIKAYFDNGIKTDNSWKCSTTVSVGWTESEYDDSSWTSAVVPSYTGWGNTPAELAANSEWIWIEGGQGQYSTVFCRKVFPDKCRFVQGNGTCGVPQLYVNEEWGYICDEPGFKPENWPTLFCQALFGHNWCATAVSYAHTIPGIIIPDPPTPLALKNPCCSPKNPGTILDCIKPGRECKRPFWKVIWMCCGLCVSP